MVSITIPYLPDILKAVVQQVNQVTTTYPDPADRFSVAFGHGLQSQVERDMYASNLVFDVFIWLAMPLEETVGENGTDVNATLMIGTITDSRYTQDQRDALTFKKKLIPAYSEFLKAVDNSSDIFQPGGQRQHGRVIKPYWAIGGPQGSDNENMWNRIIDAIIIADLNLLIKNIPKPLC